MMSPHDADLHDDHVHVRIACPDSMRDVCIEESVAHEAPARAADADARAPAAEPAERVAAGASAPVATAAREADAR